MPLDFAPIPTFEDITQVHFFEEIYPLKKPVVLKGLVSDWPAVIAANESNTAYIDYLKSCYQGMPVTLTTADKSAANRLFYTDDWLRVNFSERRIKLTPVLDKLLSEVANPTSDTFYVGSTPTKLCIPKFSQENVLPLLSHIDAIESIWIGNKSRVAAHYDVPENIACVTSGKRRFTLFPPEQINNLYTGRYDFTPAGQPISLVDFNNPDFEQHPKFKEAIKHGLVADLEPGDAIYIPRLWWHQVEGLGDINTLINYWWRDVPDYLPQPTDALKHAMLAIGHLSADEKRDWLSLFEHLVFNQDEQPLAHLPEDKRGAFGSISPENVALIKDYLAKRLG